MRVHLALSLTAACLLAACSGGDSPDAGAAAARPSAEVSPPGAGAGSSPAVGAPAGTEETAPAVVPKQRKLPRGGTTVFPEHRLVGYAGNPGSAAFGILGIGDLGAKGRDIEKRGEAYDSDGRTILPVFELIATVVHRGAGDDGMYRSRMDDEIIEQHLKAARKAKGLLLLGIQPGRADFLPEVKAYERWLKEPDVGVALDPEWAVEEGDVPGEAYGRTTGSELDVVAGYLAGLVADNGLPEKVMVYHQVARSVVVDESRLHRHAGVALVKSIDGIGGPGAKRGTWYHVLQDTPGHVHTGMKLFLEEDVERGGRLMSPAEVLALKPRPSYVLFE
ncbi:hypothetical protein [Motilibacter aurantiacus]|uniref:hypothetical protein n=1 Tax=Motilibacter aurantiacus TaxID=2714955 RepID=UPI0014075081|nr:hypothetical protein [Motilibacter aurantiacus]NHC46405.1 hypothetical protein [Motilibacter aurantiacus]